MWLQQFLEASQSVKIFTQNFRNLSEEKTKITLQHLSSLTASKIADVIFTFNI